MEVWGLGSDDLGLIQSNKASKHVGCAPPPKDVYHQMRQGPVYWDGKEVETHMESGHESVSGYEKLKEERERAWQRKGLVAREEMCVCLGERQRWDRARERER